LIGQISFFFIICQFFTQTERKLNSERSATVSELESRVREIENERDQLQSKLNDANDVVSAQTTTVEELRKEISVGAEREKSLTASLHKHEVTCSELQDKLESFEQKFNELEDHLQSERRSVATHVETIANLQQAYAAVQEELEKAKETAVVSTPATTATAASPEASRNVLESPTASSRSVPDESPKSPGDEDTKHLADDSRKVVQLKEQLETALTRIKRLEVGGLWHSYKAHNYNSIIANFLKFISHRANKRSQGFALRSSPNALAT
jgi:chromosome segregation ATPase